MGITGITGHSTGWGAYTGFQGVTGTTGVSVRCEVCEGFSIYKFMGLDFTSEGMGGRMLCRPCYEKTEHILKTLAIGPVEDLPLYISDSNIFVQYYAVERLKKLNEH